MALDPNIALGVKPLELPNQLAQYGQLAQIQNAQNQNQLAQYQLGAAQRAEKSQNMLADAYAQATDPSTGKIDYNKLTGLLAAGGGGAQLPGIEKTRRETETAALAQQKAAVELGDAKLKQSRQFLDTINPTDPNAPAQYLAWHEANHRDPILGPMLESRGVTADQSRARIEQAIQAGPTEFAKLLNQSKLGTEKFMEMNKPVTSVGPTGIVQTPGLGGAATIVPGTSAAFQMTPAQIAANAIAQQRANIEAQKLALDRQAVTYMPNATGGMEAFPSKLSPGEIPRGRAVAGAGPGMQPFQAKPSEAEGKEQMSLNQQRSIVQGALKAISETPEAFGYVSGTIPESMRGRLASPEENTNRSYLFNVVSGVIKERAGTAQSAAEAQTLNRFLPTETDNADIIKSKLNGFEKYLSDKEAGTTKRRPAANVVTNPQFPGFSIGKP